MRVLFRLALLGFCGCGGSGPSEQALRAEYSELSVQSFPSAVARTPDAACDPHESFTLSRQGSRLGSESCFWIDGAWTTQRTQRVLSLAEVGQVAAAYEHIALALPKGCRSYDGELIRVDVTADDSTRQFWEIDEFGCANAPVDAEYVTGADELLHALRELAR